jgi:ribonuclease BN (tRNA processing enzyme)
MQVRILGAHNLQTKDTHHTCLLVDDVLAVDAGSLASTTSIDEQTRLEAIMLTHLHFDHSRDLPTVGLATRDAPDALRVWAEAPTRKSVLTHLMDGEIYPDLSRSLNGEEPSLRFCEVEEGKMFRVQNYDVWPVRADHPVPTVGYIISADGRRIGITGDTGGNLMAFLAHTNPPDVLLVDVTFPDRLRWRAERSRHMTPSILEKELRGAQETGVKIPRIVAVHRDLDGEQETLSQLAGVERRLGIHLEAGYEDMVIT